MRLGWKKSTALMVVVAVGRGHMLAQWAGDLSSCAVWNRPPLTDPSVVTPPGGGSGVLKALDIKRNPADSLGTPGQ